MYYTPLHTRRPLDCARARAERFVAA